MRPHQNFLYTPSSLLDAPHQKNFKYNNTRYNNKGSKEEESIMGGSISIKNPIFFHNR